MEVLSFDAIKALEIYYLLNVVFFGVSLSRAEGEE